MSAKSTLLEERFERYLFEYGFGDSVGDCKATFIAGAKAGMEIAANKTNHYMAEQTDPAKAVAASDIKIMIRELAKEISE